LCSRVVTYAPSRLRCGPTVALTDAALWGARRHVRASSACHVARMTRTRGRTGCGCARERTPAPCAQRWAYARSVGRLGTHRSKLASSSTGEPADAAAHACCRTTTMLMPALCPSEAAAQHR
jgi:hypothetical protein